MKREPQKKFVVSYERDKEPERVVHSILEVNQEGNLEMLAKCHDHWYCVAVLHLDGRLSIMGGAPKELLNVVDLNDFDGLVHAKPGTMLGY